MVLLAVAGRRRSGDWDIATDMDDAGDGLLKSTAMLTGTLD